jgi:hypothetical protein
MLEFLFIIFSIDLIQFRYFILMVIDYVNLYLISVSFDCIIVSWTLLI